ncbi:hypothetical protein WJX77_003727 [Trebouxia sp. C0004]
MAVNIAFNNLSLVQITLSLNQVIRSCIPVICCLLAIGIENKIPTGKEIGSLVILSLGVMIAVWEGSVNGSPHGIMLCIVGTVCNAAMMSTSGRILSEKLDVLRLAFYTAPVSCIALFPFCYFRESARFMTYSQGQSMIVTAIILVGSVNALSYNVVHYLMIQMTSAVTTTVLGEVKIVGLLALSVLLLGEKSMFTTRMTVGVVLAVAGFCLYSHCKMSLQRRPAAPIVKGVPDLINPGFRLNNTQAGKFSFGRKASLGQLGDSGRGDPDVMIAIHLLLTLSRSEVPEHASHQHAKVLQILTRSGADVKSKSAEGKSALWFVETFVEARGGNWYIPAETSTYSMLSYGADVNATAGITPLMLAASIPSPTYATPLIELLCQNGATAQLRDKRAETAPTKAAATKSLTAANLLLQTGCCFDLQDNAGYTALLYS